jgi:hypothetical protein
MNIRLFWFGTKNKGREKGDDGKYKGKKRKTMFPLEEILYYATIQFATICD